MGMAIPGSNETQSRDEWFRLLTEYVQGCAAELARKGRYKAAEELLGVLADPEQLHASALDLLARICVQQRRIAQARELWLKALSRDPENEEYRSALTYIAGHKHPVGKRIVAAILACVACAAALATVILYSAQRQHHAAAPFTPAPATETGAIGSLPCFEQLRAALGNAEVLGGDGVKVSFSNGLFSDGATLTPSGRLALNRVGEAMRQCATKLDLQLIGKADAVPVRPSSRYTDNSELSLVRAAVAYGVIRRHAPDLGRVSLAGEWAAEAPSATRNPALRTVWMVIRPAVPR